MNLDDTLIEMLFGNEATAQELVAQTNMPEHEVLDALERLIISRQLSAYRPITPAGAREPMRFTTNVRPEPVLLPPPPPMLPPPTLPAPKVEPPQFSDFPMSCAQGCRLKRGHRGGCLIP